MHQSCVALIRLIIAAAARGATGCTNQTKELPQRHRVKGSITYNNKPLAGATVTFWRLPAGSSDWKAVKPIAVVEPDGSFEPNSYDDKDGAVEGEYALTLIYRLSRTSPDVFAGRYNDTASPIAKVIVVPGENTIPPIQLTGPEVNTPTPDSKGGQ